MNSDTQRLLGRLTGAFTSLRKRLGGRGWERLFDDPAFLRQMLISDKRRVMAEMAKRYSLVPREYIESYLNHLIEEHIDNPRLMQYAHAEFSGPGRQLDLMKQLENQGFVIAGKRCLDIGCSTGALALACHKAGAADVLGIDVQEDRLAAARRLCAGTPIRLKNFDILDQSLGESFHAIFGTSVLEHVPDAKRLLGQLGAHLARSEGAFAYMDLTNMYLMRNVLSEPHYGVPGMVLMPYREAKPLWYEVRAEYKSSLEYEVFHWHGFWELHEMAAGFGLELSASCEEATLDAAIVNMSDYPRVADEFAADFARTLEESPVPTSYRSGIREHVGAYLDEFRRDHERRAGSREREDARFLYLKYYAEPLYMTCTHATR